MLLLVGGVFAQTSFIQSRFLGMPLDANATCETCTPNVDGVLEYKLAEPTIESKGETPSTATFTVQMRIIGGNAATKNRTRLSFASARLAYNTAAFGERVVENGTCEYEAALGDNYNYTFNDSTTDAFTLTASTTTEVASNLLAGLTAEFQDFATIVCEITSAEQQAGIAISGTDITSNMIYVYNDLDDVGMGGERRIMFPLAHNSLRGWRLDGKTYAEDYALYSDGTGVRLKFSAPISSQLMDGDFVIEPPDSSITLMSTHFANSADAVVEFSGGVPTPGTILKLADPVVSDSNLPAGNFIAALNYDENAPRATGISMVSREGNKSSWVIKFSHALDAGTVDKDNLCLSEEAGVCSESSESSAAAIESLSYENGTTTVTVVINETASRTDDLSIVFDRNTFRGVDQRAVEEDQVELRNGITTDNAGPVITVVALPEGSAEAIAANDVYTIDFKVTANESVPTLDEPSSYQLQSINKDTNVLSNVSVSSSPDVAGSMPDKEVTLSYKVPFNEITDLQNIGGFTLARSALATSLVDLNNNPPVKSDKTTQISTGDTIAPLTAGVVASEAVARRDTAPPAIWVNATGIEPSNAGKTYKLTYEVNSDESVPSIGMDASYELLHLVSANPIDFSGLDGSATPNAASTMATVTFTVTIDDYDDVRRTTGFTLVRAADALRDNDGNDPTKGGAMNKGAVIMDGARIDDDGGAEARRDTVGPTLTVAGDVKPDAANGNKYVVSFTVTSDETIDDIAEIASYKLTHEAVDGATMIDDLTGLIEDSTATETGTGATVGYDLTLSLAQTRATKAFVLTRVADKLLDAYGNLPQVGVTEIADGGELATAERDSAAPKIDVTAQTPTLVDDNDASKGYEIVFTATLAGSDAVKDIRGFGKAASYTLLQLASSGDTGTAVADAPTPAVIVGAGTATTATITYSGVNVTPLPYGFNLGRSNDDVAGECNLCDLSNNAPVEFVADTPVGNGEALDSGAEAVIPVIPTVTKPTITVEAIMDAMPDNDNGNIYTMTFEVEADEVVTNIGDADSYQLKRIRLNGELEDVGVSDVKVDRKDKAKGTTATISYTTDALVLAVTTDTRGFTLAFVAGTENLRDADNNVPQDRGNNDLADGERIDPSDDAIAVRDTDAPAITVRPTDATATVAADYSYSGSFTVSATEDIRDIAEAGSYQLLRIPSSGPAAVIAATLMPTPDTAQQATIGFEVTLADAATARATLGFTLRRNPNGGLRDLSNNDATIDTADTAARILRDTTAPTLTVAGDVKPDDDDGNKYVVSFTVTSTEAIGDIAEIASYQLTHKATANVIDDLTTIIESSKTTPVSDGATVEYTLTLRTLAETRATTGFALVRVAGKLLDADGNLPQVGVTEIADGGELATAERDSAAPKIDVTAETPTLVDDNDASKGYEIVFTATLAGSDAVKDIRGFGKAASYTLLQLASSGDTGTAVADAPTPAVIVGAGTATTATITYSGVNVTPLPYGFNLGRSNDDVAGECNLCDLSNNAPVEFVADTPVGNGEALDSGAEAVIPVIPTVTKPTITVEAIMDAMPDNDNGNIYTMTFEVEADEVVTNIGDADSYQLKRIRLNGELEDVGVSDVKVDRKDKAKGTTATITYTTDALVLAVTTDTRGFTLAFVAGTENLRDADNNVPQDRDDNDLADGERIDPSDDAIAVRDTAAPAITVRPTDATATVAADYSYSGSFTVSAEEDIRDIAEAGSYQLLRIPSSGPAAVIAATLTPTADTAQQATIGFEVMLADAATARATLGFTLRRNPNGGLRDLSNNDATIDTADTAARILRDTTAPTLTVAGDVKPDDDDGNKYVVSFTVTSTEAIGDIAEIASYQLTHKATANVIDDLTTIIESSKATPVSDGATVEYTLTLRTLAETRATTGFALVRVAGRLLDADGNLPQVGVTEIADGGELAMVARDSAAPKIDVTAQTPTLVDDNDASKGYEIVFTATLAGSDAVKDIRGFGEAASYTLLQLASSGDTGTAVADAPTPAVIVGAGTATTATITYSGVNVTPLPYGFNLGRSNDDVAGECNLCDLSNNAPVEFVADTPVDNGEALDSGAEAVIPVIPTVTKPTITVEAIMDAMPDNDNGNIYTMTFEVEADEVVTNIGDADSYQLKRIRLNGELEDVGVSDVKVDRKDKAKGTTATITYTTDALVLAVTTDTRGFTLAFVAGTENLRDADNNVPQDRDNNDLADGERIDPSDDAIAVRDTDAPAITVRPTDATATVAADYSYSGSFTVSAEEDIRDIAEAGSYQLLRIPSSGPAAVIAATLTPTPDTAQQATIGFEVMLADAATARATLGFTLRRNPNGGLRDLSNNDATIDTADTAARILRDTTAPTLTVAGDVKPDDDDGNKYVVSFTITSDEAIGDIADIASYQLTHKATANVIDDLTTIIESSKTTPVSDGATVEYTLTLRTLAETRATTGFALVRVAGKLLDADGNLPQVGVTEIADGDELATAERDSAAPKIDVTAETPTLVDDNDASKGYEIVFTATLAGSDAVKDIRGFGKAASYTLLQLASSGDTGTAVADAPTPAVIVGAGTATTATITYSGVNVTPLPYGFNLGRSNDDVAGECNLCDLSNNAPVEFVADTPVGNGEALDSGAEAVIPVIPTVTKPTITVEAIMDAMPDNDNGNIYTMTFEVEADEVVTNIGDADSYQLKRIRLNGELEDVGVSDVKVDRKDKAKGTTATISYTTDALVLAVTTDTRGFTLAFVAGTENLRDADNNAPQDRDNNDLADGERIDPSDDAIAVRDTDAPAITVRPTDATATVAANYVYSGSFTVSATEDIRDIAEAGSYQLLRIPSSGPAAVIAATLMPTADTAQQATIGFEVTLADAATARATLGFTLRRNPNGGLRDLSNNDATIDTADTAARILRDTTAPTLTVAGDVKPDDDDGNKYVVSFTVTSTEAIGDIAEIASYQLTHKATANVIDDLTTIIESSKTTPVSDGATVEYTLTLRTLAETRATTGFALVRVAGKLLDADGNLPQVGVTEIADGGELATAERDSAAPKIDVTAETPTLVDDNDASKGYEIVFTATLAGSDAAKDIRGFGEAASYTLLQLASSGDTGTAVADAPTPAVIVGAGTATTATITYSGVNVTPLPYGFNLGRSNDDVAGECNLCDLSNNAPVEFVADTPVGNGEALDSGAEAVIPVIPTVTKPTITVEAIMDAMPDNDNGNIYTMTFEVEADEVVTNIGDADSYQLKRIRLNGELEDVGVSDVKVDRKDKAKGTTATITYTTDALVLAVTTDTRGFTLAFVAGTENLRDADNNVPQDRDDNDLADGERIDPSDDAIAVRDTDAPAITVRPTDATATVAADYSYSGSFTVSAEEDIRDIAEAGSYQLLRIPSSGPAAVIAATLTPTPDTAQQATIGFEAMLADAATARATLGFTLRRNPNGGLRDLSNNDAMIDITDTDARILRDTTAPTLTVAGTVKPDDDDGNKYVVRFTVTSDEAIGDIAEIASYQLTHKATANVIDDLTTIIESSKATPVSDGATVEYTLTLRTLAETRATTGFALVRVAGRLLDADGNLPQVGVTEIADGGELAMVARDSAAPKFDVTAQTPTLVDDNDASKGYEIVFTATLAGSDAVKDIRGFGKAASYTLLQLASSGDNGTAVADAPTPAVIVGAGTATTATITYSGVNVTPLPYGFNLGRSNDDVAGECNLCDLSNNAPVEFVADTPVGNGEALDSGAEAVIPVIPTVTKPTITVEAIMDAMPDNDNGNIYTMTFEVEADEVVTNIGDADSYQLKRIRLNGELEDVGVSDVKVDRKDKAKGTTATITYTTDALVLAVTTDTRGFTLAFVAGTENLRDADNNAPQDRDDNDLADGERIDPSDDAIAVRDTDAPAITVRPTDATATVAADYSYSGSFTVSAEEDIRDIAEAGSYQLLRIPSSGPAAVIAATLTPTADTAQQATIDFEVTLADAATARATLGFTLRRNPNGGLRDLSNNDATIDTADTAARILRDTTAPTLTVAGTVKPDDDDGNKYVVSFTITSDEAIGDIADIASYQLTHKATNSADVIADLTTIIESSVPTTVENGVKVDYTLTFGSLAETRATTGFALVRVAGRLLDADGNLPQVGVTEIADGGELATAERDSAAPKIDVTAETPTLVDDNDASKGYEIVFTATLAGSDAVKDIRGFGKAASYTLLQLASSGDTGTAVADAPTPAVIVGAGTATTATITYSGVNVTPLPYGFNLGRSNDDVAGECNLCDLSNNAPVEFVADTPVGNGEALDSGAEAVIPVIPTVTKPTITVEAIMDAMPDNDNGNIYTMTFEVEADEVVTNIGDADSYQLKRIRLNGELEDVGVSDVKVDRKDKAKGTTATISYTTDALVLAVTTDTRGFTLAFVAGTENLRDADNNAPQDRDDNDLVDGERIDPSDDAIAERDSAAPKIDVTAETPTLVDDNDASKGYEIVFTATLAGSDAVKDIRGFGKAASYTLLQLASSGDTGTAVADAPTPAVIVGAGTATTATITYSGVNVTPLPYGFNLGRSNDDVAGECNLCDLSNNAPVEFVADTPVGNGEALDSGAEAVIPVIPTVTKPTITVEAIMDAMPDNDNGNIYTMTFEVEADEVVTNIGDADSYQLKRIRLNGELEDVGVSDVKVDRKDKAKGTTATITYTTDALVLAVTTDTRGFTLAFVAGTENLRDADNNAPQDRDDNDLVDGERIDPSDDAIAVRDTDAPAITVRPTDATATVAANYVYSGSFMVSATEDIRDIAEAGSYQLLRIPSSGPAAVIAATLTPTPDTAQQATIGFEVTLADAATARATLGFTLRRNPNGGLRDLSNNDATIDTADTAARILRDTTAPTLTVAGDVKPDDDDGNKYVVSFTVTSTEAIGDIAEIASYQLTHKATANVIDDLTTIIESSKTTPVSDGATVEYTLTLRTLAETRATTGFALVRVAGRLLDADGNLPQVGVTEIADGGELATAERDSAAPKIDVTAETPTLVDDNDASKGYEIVFTATLAGSDAVKDIRGFGKAASYTLLQLASSGDTGTAVADAPTPAVIVGAGTATTATITYSGVNVTPLPYGFNLGRSNDDVAGECNLCDLSNNAPVEFVADTPVGNGEALDSGAEAVIPVIPTVTKPTITVEAIMDAMPDNDNGNIYTMTFEVEADEVVTNIGDADSYQLKRIRLNGELEDVGVSDVKVDRKDKAKGTTATITYTTDALVLAVTTDTRGFTLAFVAGTENLRDADNNVPQDRDDNDLVDGERIDPSDDAIAVRDTAAPAITVRPTDATATVAADYSYSGSFTVSAEEDIRDIAEAGSYQLLRIPSSGPAAVIAATLMPTADTAQQATIGFEVMLADAATARATLGFTLRRNPNGGLRDLSNNDATIDTADTAARILRDTTAPTLTVAGTVKPDDDDGNKYVVSFTITSDEAIGDIADIASYQLTHKATNSADVIADLTTIIESSVPTTVENGVKVDYTLTFGSLAETRATTGFALVRVAGRLLDADGNLPQVGVTEIADGGELATAERDSAAPKIDVTAETPTLVDDNDASKGYEIVFTATLAGSDAVKDIRGFGKAASYTLLQLASSGDTGTAVADAPTPAVIVGAGTATTATITYSGVNVTPLPYGFNLGRSNDDVAGECNLCDLSNNAPVEFVADTPVGNGEALDSGAEAVIPTQDVRLTVDITNIPSFNLDSETTKTNVRVANSVDMVTVTATPVSDDATITGFKVIGMPAVNNGDVILLDVGVTKIEIEVTAEDGTTQDYIVEITRATAGIRIRAKVFLEGPLQ